MKIYAVNIEQLKIKNLFYEAYEMVDEVRKEKVDACRREEDKLRSLGAGLLFAYALAETLNSSWSVLKDQISFEYGEHEKPYLKPWKGICFNLSHSGSYAVCAITVGENLYEYEEKNEVGIDIQKLIPCNLRTGKKAFSEAECKRLEALLLQDEKKAALEFSKLWSNKESRGKLLGTGVFLQESEEKEVFGREYEFAGEYIVSVAGFEDCFVEEVCEMRIDELMNIL
ncbi:MAG: 4'-phosphopantetheinyl transferase superfamily protein [Lachnospiraceae bacterium]|nr:4'-phosphopantetheinyl transferase superfamily protein [Lachnospiraceae bacterium]